MVLLDVKVCAVVLWLAASCVIGMPPDLQARPIQCATSEHNWPAEGYKMFPNAGYYKFHAYGAEWPMARQVCEEEGAHLVIVNSEVEAALLRTLIAAHPTSTGVKPADAVYSWVGVHERGRHGEYFTIFGDPLTETGFWSWNGGESNDGGSNDCVLFSSKTGRLADNVCTNRFPFVCEIEMSQVDHRRSWLTAGQQ